MRFIHAVLPRESVAPLYPRTNSLQISKRQTWLLLVLFYKRVIGGVAPTTSVRDSLGWRTFIATLHEIGFHHSLLRYPELVSWPALFM